MSIVNPVLGDSPVRTFGLRTFDFSRQCAVMAIVNRTPDSFYDKGRTFSLESAVAAADKALASGADWVDVGGAPFSPFAEPVDETQEIERVVPVIMDVRQKTDAVISVDTSRYAVAREAISAGADVINDTSGLHDTRIADLVAETDSSLVITHSQGHHGIPVVRPEYVDVVNEVRSFLIHRAEVALRRGVSAERIIVDPGHDLNKNTYHSLELTRNLGEISALGYPLLVSVSNKDFIRETLGREEGEVLEGTLATLVVCVLQGARILRVHNVGAAVDALRTLASVLGWEPPSVARHNLV